MSGGGNPNHDPKTGEFSSGPSGSAGASHGRIDSSRGLTPGDGKGGSAGMSPSKADQLRAAFDTHVAELNKNISAMEKSRAAFEPQKQTFNRTAQRMFGRNTKVKL